MSVDGDRRHDIRSLGLLLLHRTTVREYISLVRDHYQYLDVWFIPVSLCDVLYQEARRCNEEGAKTKAEVAVVA